MKSAFRKAKNTPAMQVYHHLHDIARLLIEIAPQYEIAAEKTAEPMVELRALVVRVFNPTNEQNEDAQMKLLNEFLAAKSIMRKIDCIVLEMRAVAEKRALAAGSMESLRPVENIASMIATVMLKTRIQKKQQEDSTFCQCGGKFEISGWEGEIVCMDCGIIEHNSYFNSCGFVGQSISRTQDIDHGKHRRHCLLWIDRIQGIDSPDIPVEKWEELINNIDQYGIPRAGLTTEIVREKFKELGMTKYNSSAPYVVKRLGGPVPPLLTAEEREMVLTKFLRLLELFAVACPNATNAPYYPYFIYRVIENLFAGNRAKLRLLKFIHLQSPDTIIKNDTYYAAICKFADKEDDLHYSPTSERTTM